MTLFDLLFIAIFLTSVALVLRSLYLVLRGRRERAVRILAWWGGFLVVYLGIEMGVSLTTPQRVLQMGEDRCFDDWCLVVDGVRLAPSIGQGEGAARAQGVFYIVTIRVSSRAKRVSQRAPDSKVILTDRQEKRYDPSPAGQKAYEAANGPAAPLGALLAPGASFTTVRVFDLPKNAVDPSAIVLHGEGPGWFVIGDDASLLHKRTVIRLRTSGS
jgi:hypothetical protein